MGQGDQLGQYLSTKIKQLSLEEDNITQSPYKFLPTMSNTQANRMKHASEQVIQILQLLYNDIKNNHGKQRRHKSQKL